MPLFNEIWHVIGMISSGIGDTFNSLYAGIGQIGTTTSQVLGALAKTIGLG